MNKIRTILIVTMGFLGTFKQSPEGRLIVSYAVVAFVLMQLMEIIFPTFNLPQWASQVFVAILIAGFPIVFALSFFLGEKSKERRENFLSTNFNFSDKLIRLSIPIVISVFGIYWGFSKFSDYELPEGIDTSLAVLSFENLSSENETSSRMGQIIQELVISDLSNLSSLVVFSSQRIRDLYKQIAGSTTDAIDQSIGIEISKKAGANTMLSGNIMSLAGKTIITSNLVDVNTGRVLKSQKVQGRDIYSLVDELTNLVRTDLNLELNEDVSVSNKTSNSLEAYDFYLAGLELTEQHKWDFAVKEFRKAVTIDANFKEAWYQLGFWSFILNFHGFSGMDDYKESIENMLNKGRNLTPIDSLLAKGTLAYFDQDVQQAKPIFEELVKLEPNEKFYWFLLGDLKIRRTEEFIGALEALERAIQLDPSFELAYYNAFEIYSAYSMHSKGLESAKKLIDANPNSSNGFGFLGLMEASLGNIQKGIKDIEKSISLDPSNPIPKLILAGIYLNIGEKEKFSALSREVISGDTYTALYKNFAFAGLSMSKVLSGEFDSANDLIEEWIKMEDSWSNGWWDGPFQKAYFFIESGEYNRAFNYIDDFLEKGYQSNQWHLMKHLQGVAAARKGDRNLLDSIIKEMQNFDYQTSSDKRPPVYGATVSIRVLYFFQAVMDKDYTRAMDQLNVLKQSLYWPFWVELYEIELLITMGKLDAAIAKSNKLSEFFVHSIFFSLWYSDGAAYSSYYKGKIYDQMGNKKDAISEYMKFLNQWENADEGTPKLEDARSRIAVLIQEPN